MTLDLAGYDDLASAAVRMFWGNRAQAAQRQAEQGRQDAGTRGAVTAGKNMDGFVDLAEALVRANGLPHAQICLQKRVLTLPGFFRPTKQWDMLVLDRGELIAGLEFKSQVGSFGNNFNNRTEEAIGTAHDFWTAYREGAFGQDAPRPFVGWVMLLEEACGSTAPVGSAEPHFPVFGEFQGASYAARYDLLCRKLIMENLYTSATLMLSPRTAAESGDYRSLSDLTSLKSFVTEFAGHISSVAAKRR